ncbi:MAG: hypothetical protein ABI881_14325 [Betaproteobacteria bacterium]
MLWAATAAAAWWLLGPHTFDLHSPLIYSGDGLSHAFLVKTIIDVGWFPVHTPWVGAPFGSDLFDYPFSDALNFLLIWLLGRISSDWVVVVNLFYLATYFLAGASAFFVLRTFHIARPLAVSAALLFAFLPFHWLRSVHLLLVSYAIVPLGVWLAHVAWRGTSAQQPRSRSIAIGVIALAVGSAGAYYAYFSAFLVGVAGVGRTLATSRWRNVMPAAAIIGVIAAALVLNVTPTLWYRASHGANPEVAVRGAAESEVYALRLTQLVLPHAKHRIEWMREIAQRYASEAPLVNENASASLGIAGVAGLLVLVLVAIRRIAGATGKNELLPFLAILAICAFLLGTIGGVGSLIAFLVSPVIRGYNRISVVIGFLSLAGLVAWIQWMLTPKRGSPREAAIIAISVVLAAIGVLDQTPRDALAKPTAQFDEDRAFVHAIEARVTPGTMVWQLPYEAYPEGGAFIKSDAYGGMRGYLNSTTLRWSYGAMRGREADRWIRALAAHPVREQVDLAARSGFGAVSVDRRGFADHGAEVEKELRNSLGAPIVESGDGMMALYALNAAGALPLPLASILAPIDAPIRFDARMLGGRIAKLTGISGWEPWGRWTEGPVARIEFTLPLPDHFVLRVDTAVAMRPSAGVDLGIRVGNVERKFKVGAHGSTVEIPFDTDGRATAIEIHIPEPRSPRQLGIGEDDRKLGIGLKSIAIEPIVAAR